MSTSQRTRSPRLGLLLVTAIAFSLLADPVGATDRFALAKFDVDGVQLYMSASQVLEVIQSKFGAKARVDFRSADDRLHPGRTFISEITYHGSNYVLDVRLIEWTDPGEPGWSSAPQTETVNQIAMWLVGATDADRENFRAEVLAKYPRSDHSDRDDAFTKTWTPLPVERWCTGALFDYQHICDLNNPFMYLHDRLFSEGNPSVLDNTTSYGILIGDGAPEIRVQQALRAQERAQQRITHGRPPL